jgi:RNA polymerase sigma-70 factor (ECF subfamily)
LDFASAEDVVQQVFVKLLRAGEPGPLLPLAYAYRAVRNSSMNLRRDRQREMQLPENETWLIRPGGKPEEALALQQALRELPPEQQEAVFLRIWNGMTLQEIADASETPLHTVASRYRYALEKLRERLK